jgi:glycosyltransferase involved in cell wall biosynthesis
MMRTGSLASIIIDNYNYGRFLRDAIDSALSQAYPHTEVVVVDDGSTDDSREIIAGYGGRVTAVLKENGGMGSALNAGFQRSRGEVVLFLDADDTLLPAAVGNAVRCFQDPDVVQVHWPLWKVDEHGSRTGGMIPGAELAEGDLRQVVIARGPASYVTSPTTGNSWSRRFLAQVFPVPEAEFRRIGESFLVTVAPAFGTIRRVAEPQGCYRVHGANYYAGMTLAEKAAVFLASYEPRCLALAKHLRDRGVKVDAAAWRERNPYYGWMERVRRAADELEKLIPPGEMFILVDGGEWGDIVAGRRILPFLKRGGEYWGPPPDDATAIRELGLLRRAGARYIAFGWPAFWWLDYYADLARHLRAHFRCALDNDRLVAFDLRP